MRERERGERQRERQDKSRVRERERGRKSDETGENGRCRKENWIKEENEEKNRPFLETGIRKKERKGS